MARLHVLGDWHGPGEEKTARRLRDELPDTWDIVAGRDVPDGMGTVDLDLVVVGPRAVYVCEEKSWGPHIVAGDVAWFVNGERRHSPNSQVQHATRVLAGNIKKRVTGWREAESRFARGHRIVRGHVVLSHDHLRLDGAEDLGDDVVLRLADAAQALQRLDATCPESMAPLRRNLMDHLLGLRARPAGEPPSQIFQYRVEGRPMSRGDAVVYRTRNPANELVDLICVPVAAASDPVRAHLLATREHDALAALASVDRAWRVQGWFEWNGYVVTPVVVPTDGTSLRKLVASRRSPVDDRGRVTPDIGVAVVHDAFRALAEVHRLGITHRALRLLSVEVTDADRVRFRDFGRAHLPSAATVAPDLDDDHPSAAFRAPGATLEMFTPADDLYSLALCLVQWLHGDVTDQPDHRQALERAREYPTVGSVLVRCLTREPGAAYTAAEAAEATAPRRPVPAPPPRREEVIAPGALLGGRYRLVRQLGEGAWAVTWLAYDENLDEHRTVKHLRPGRVAPEQVKAEYDHANMLRSFFCARMHDRLALPEPGVLVQEYVPGETLHELTTGRPELDREQARRIAVDVLRGLADAHDRSIYHRDVSPNNIIVRDDGHAVLIDFGLASRAEAAQSAVGSPPFTAPEVWSRRQWSPSADIYSAAASVLHAMLGRLPYAGPGIDERRTLVPPTAAQVERYGRALLDSLYRAVEANPVARPGDARSFADELQRVSDIVVAPGRRVVNPTVAALRGLYRHSGIGNAGNRGLDDDFAHDTYVATRLDSELLPAILAGRLDVVVLSGNPGDGKTSFLVKVGAALDKAGAVVVHADAAGWRRRLDGRTYAAVYDASESHGELTSDDLMCQALDPGEGDDPALRTVLLAANDGRIAQFCLDHADRYPEITAALDRQRLGGEVETGARIVLVDLKRRALALPDLNGPALGANVLSSLTVLHRWEVCEGCEARKVCPIRRNAELLRAGQARRAVSELLLTSHLRRRRRATVRDVRSAFGWLVTGDLSCDDVHDEVEQGLDPGIGRQAFDLAFDASSGDYLVQEWSELDPAQLPAPAVARAARDRRDLVPDLASLDTETMTHLKRALFFGSWSVPTARHEVRSYRHLELFLDTLQDPDAGLSRILLGVSRVLAFVGYRDEGHLALRDRVFDDPAVRSIVVVKELPATEFRLVSATTAAPYVESFPDRLELHHAPSGARLRITLDTAELLLRSADGEVMGDSASAALRQEIQGFGDRLRLQPARTVRIVDGAGSWVTATATDAGHIVAGAHR
ncbi:protein kinase [Pseudonocardia sp. KRD-184]|uniref:Protein kinase n=1 Tax=Pseudonocardia oceani TaxID=2792013 RepID=A0ABS6UFK6_9PSEU|nr:protein kinase [Pseudonocardia oceani]MBW0089612.1 protein kinase [Pseudonocardia oceani]MBW0096651.1 protein kinase [Pseudonocardia oceani]MBW0109357.1 protein kinase [Pseudonocardia oceani]MBW0123433.1 protein kinase [Pseudonocardia oceani]MBW0130706.1 protein kinase [Pseudonocardia oceani]